MTDIILTPPSTGEISQYYANSSDRGVHSGNDYKYSSGGKIHQEAVAMADGIVEWADDTRKLGWPNAYYFNPDFDRSDNVDHSAGIAVVIRHPQFDNWKTTYCHLETTPLNIGQQVKRGQYVGTVGQTGFSLGKHLHAELIPANPDFSTPTGGRADLNKYMVNSVPTAAPAIVKDWFDMADEAMLEKVIDRVLDRKLAQFQVGIPGQRNSGETYKAIESGFDKTIKYVQAVADVDRKFITDEIKKFVQAVADVDRAYIPERSEDLIKNGK